MGLAWQRVRLRDRHVSVDRRAMADREKSRPQMEFV